MKIPNFSIDLLKPSELSEPDPSAERQALEDLASQLGVEVRDKNGPRRTKYLAEDCYRAVLHLKRAADNLKRLYTGAKALSELFNLSTAVHSLFG